MTTLLILNFRVENRKCIFHLNGFNITIFTITVGNMTENTNTITEISAPYDVMSTVRDDER